VLHPLWSTWAGQNQKLILTKADSCQVQFVGL
jgi:hypothetical protein